MKNKLLQSAVRAGKKEVDKKVGSLQPSLRASHTSLSTFKATYGKVRPRDVLMQCMYQVTIEDIFGVGKSVPWFKDKNLRYLVTEADISFGGSESESYQAGAYIANYMTQQTADDMDLTFIETISGDIFNSYRACRSLIFNDDGTVNEPKKYVFKLSIALLNHKGGGGKGAPIGMSWLVAVKDGRTEVSSAGRSEIVKSTITFQKMMPMLFAK